MAYLVEVFRVDDHPPLQRRQSLLMIEDQLMDTSDQLLHLEVKLMSSYLRIKFNVVHQMGHVPIVWRSKTLKPFCEHPLWMVMDLNGLDLVHENVTLKNKDVEEFLRKYNFLSPWELKNAFQITIKDVVNILGESIPCVGCRRRVERLYYQLMGIGEMALDPLLVKSDGTLVIKEDVLKAPRSLCSIFADHSERLTNLVDSQPRLKKSRRCVLHSWDLYKSRPVTPAWKDVWAVMQEKCKAEVLLIDFSTLLSKLENYLKKHRFCADCRTKVMKAYNLLVEEGDPTKEKGFVASLYQKIKRCLPGKHIHLPNETKYIDSLIARAEPELMGNRRERHAKTMEIAQEEVLTCIGICVYDRLRRIYVRLQEEEFTCRVLAAVSVEALCRNFETAVEKKRGVTQLELLCEEITKEELAKQQRKETKKLKKKRKKEKRNELDAEGKDGCECETDECLERAPEENRCECPKVKSPAKGNHHKLQILDRKSKGQLKCSCDECSVKNENQSDGVKTSQVLSQGNKSKKGKSKGIKESTKSDYCKTKKSKENNNVVDCQTGTKESSTSPLEAHCHSCLSARGSSSVNRKSGDKGRTPNDHAHDQGYSSEHNNGSSDAPSASSSLNCSPEGSEVACSEGFCDHDGDCISDRIIEKKNPKSNAHFSLLLEEMLEKASSDVADEDDCFIPPEEIQAFKAKMPLVDEKRSQLRQILKNRFAQLCIKSQTSKS